MTDKFNFKFVDDKGNEVEYPKSEVSGLIEQLEQSLPAGVRRGPYYDLIRATIVALREAYKPVDDERIRLIIHCLRVSMNGDDADLIERLARQLAEWRNLVIRWEHTEVEMLAEIDSLKKSHQEQLLLNNQLHQENLTHQAEIERLERDKKQSEARAYEIGRREGHLEQQAEIERLTANVADETKLVNQYAERIVQLQAAVMKPEIAELIDRISGPIPMDNARFKALRVDIIAALKEAYKPVDDEEVEILLCAVDENSPVIMGPEDKRDIIERLARGVNNWKGIADHNKRTTETQLRRNAEKQAEIEQLRDEVKARKKINKDLGEKLHSVVMQRDQALRDLSISIEKNEELQAAINRLADPDIEWSRFSEDYAAPMQQYAEQFATKPASQEEARKAGSKARLQEIAEVATKPEGEL